MGRYGMSAENKGVEWSGTYVLNLDLVNGVQDETWVI